MGEHAAVYQRPALVAAVDRRLTVELEAAASGVILELPQMDLRIASTWNDILAYSHARRELWQRYDEAPSPESFARLLGDDPAHLVKVSLGEGVDHLGDQDPPPIVLRLDSRLPIGAGFGSSAAVAVAISRAYLAFRGVRISNAELHQLAQNIERRQHGRPSGVDSAAVIHGGLIWARKNDQGHLEMTALPSRSPLLENFRVFHTGSPRESTGAVVAAVSRLAQGEPNHFAEILQRLENAAVEVREELVNPEPDPKSLLVPIRAVEAGLEELGVVPPRVRAIVRQVERAGGAAKISGAGSLSDPGAGSLLVYHPDPDRVTEWPFLRDLEALDLDLGAPGVREA